MDSRVKISGILLHDITDSVRKAPNLHCRRFAGSGIDPLGLYDYYSIVGFVSEDRVDTIVIWNHPKQNPQLPLMCIRSA